MIGTRCFVAAAVVVLLMSGPCWAANNFHYLGMLACSGMYKAGGFFWANDPGYATEGYDSAYDKALDKVTPSVPIYVATYHTDGVAGWNAASGFYDHDARPPLMPGQSRTEDIYLWAESGAPTDGMRIDYSTATTPNWSLTLNLVSVPSGVTYTGLRTWGLSSTGTWIGLFPYYVTTDGRTGYHFQAIFTVVPEPSSLAAILAALSSLGAMMTLRRRARPLSL
jgi:hypothetical protein